MIRDSKGRSLPETGGDCPTCTGPVLRKRRDVPLFVNAGAELVELRGDCVLTHACDHTTNGCWQATVLRVADLIGNSSRLTIVRRVVVRDHTSCQWHLFSRPITTSLVDPPPRSLLWAWLGVNRTQRNKSRWPNTCNIGRLKFIWRCWPTHSVVHTKSACACSLT